MTSGRWDMANWKKQNGVSLFEALGIHKGKVQFPALGGDTIAKQVSTSGSTSGASGGNQGNPSGGTEQQNQALGKQMAAAQPYNWTGAEWDALNNIVMAESGWNTTADNPQSGAYGIPQALPGSKMASAGSDWQTDPRTQIAWMLGYIRSRYGDPVTAWQWHLAHNWY